MEETDLLARSNKKKEPMIDGRQNEQGRLIVGFYFFGTTINGNSQLEHCVRGR
jgi:hypothetical protein